MANGITTSTAEDRAIQARRWNRAVGRYAQQCVGWSIGRGYEADYLEGMQMSDMVRYSLWLKCRAAFNGSSEL